MIQNINSVNSLHISSWCFPVKC